MDLATLNLIRKGNGLEPLTELPADVKEPGSESSAAGSENKKDDQTKVEDAKKEDGAAADADKKDEKPELTDEELLALLAKKGIAATTLEDLRKKGEVVPDPELTTEQKEAAELAFGLTKGLFTKAEYDQFIADSKDTKNLVYAEFYNETKAEDPTLTDEEIEADFLASYGLDKDKESYQFKRALKKIKSGGEALLKEKYKKIYEAKGAYTQTDTDAKNAMANQKKVAAALPAYKADVNAIIGDLKKITIKMSDTDNIELDAETGDLEAIQSDLLNPDYYSSRLVSGYDKEKIKQAVVAGYLAKNFTNLTVKVAKKYLDKHKGGAHGVDLGGIGGGGKVVEYDPANFTEAQKQIIEFHKAEAAKSAK